jgi:uncharacterized protein YbjT (DUF2867 family)
MRLVVFGATGYLGTRLIPELLAAGHDVRVLARNQAKLEKSPWRQQVEVIQGDVTDEVAVAKALADQEVLYYLVHSLERADFVDRDAAAALEVGSAAAKAGLTRIVYLGGIIPAGQNLSDHLASRAQVGELLRAGGVPTTELRAAAIIGSGSASFELLRYLAERLPVVVSTPWLHTKVQPIAVHDVLYYLVQSASLPANVNRSFDIGGPDTFSYLQMMRKVRAIAGLWRQLAVPVPMLPPSVGAQGVNVLTPIPGALAASLMESLQNDLVCGEHDIVEHIPEPECGLAHFERAVELALARVRGADVSTRWSDGSSGRSSSDPLPSDPDWSGGSLYEDVKERRTPADSIALWRAVESIGGEQGWYSFPFVWSLRGWVNEFTRRAGLRIGRLNSQRLHTGAALDWWRVEDVDQPRLLRLRSTLPMPGRLWLELSVEPDSDGGAIYRQRALFQPYGLAGHAFWRGLYALHQTVFGGIQRSMVSGGQDVTASERLAASNGNELAPRRRQLRSL